MSDSPPKGYPLPSVETIRFVAGATANMITGVGGRIFNRQNIEQCKQAGKAAMETVDTPIGRALLRLAIGQAAYDILKEGLGRK